MSDVNLFEQSEKILHETSDVLVDSANQLVDISLTLEALNIPQASVLKQAVENVNDSLLNANLELLKKFFTSDERDEYLDNLKGYFNEETGTWYDQICENFKKLTGFSMNKWSALTWTIHLSLGHSTFDYLVHSDYIARRNGKWTVDDMRHAEVFGWDVERIQHLIDTNFEELKAVNS